MNQILAQVEKYMREALNNTLPEINNEDLEDGGAVFYMNGKNGTAFDWYFNDHLPSFFIFYKDKENLGAVKATLYSDGVLSVYVYGDQGHADPEENHYNVEADEDQLLKLAVLFTENADEKKIWDADIRKIASEGSPDEQSVYMFIESKQYYLPAIERRNLWAKTAIVSKIIREEGWKIGYGMRDEPTDEGDSGWYFGAGNESDDYVNDASNLELWRIGSVLMYDQALTDFITAPYGTALIRVDHDKFEIDAPGKEGMVEKMKS